MKLNKYLFGSSNVSVSLIHKINEKQVKIFLETINVNLIFNSILILERFALIKKLIKYVLNKSFPRSIPPPNSKVLCLKIITFRYPSKKKTS